MIRKLGVNHFISKKAFLILLYIILLIEVRFVYLIPCLDQGLDVKVPVGIEGRTANAPDGGGHGSRLAAPSVNVAAIPFSAQGIHTAATVPFSAESIHAAAAVVAGTHGRRYTASLKQKVTYYFPACQGRSFGWLSVPNHATVPLSAESIHAAAAVVAGTHVAVYRVSEQKMVLLFRRV